MSSIVLSSDWKDIIAYIITLVTFIISLLLTVWIQKRHADIRGPSPEWKNRVFLILLFYLPSSLYHVLTIFLGHRISLYLESLLGIWQAYLLRELFDLFLFLYHDKQQVTFSHKDRLVQMQESNMRIKVEEKFSQSQSLCLCIKPNPLLLLFIESIIVMNVIVRFISALLIILFLHYDIFYHYSFVLRLINLSFLSITFIVFLLFIGFTNNILWPFLPRLKLCIVAVPLFLSTILIFLFPLSLATILNSFITISFLLSTLWIYPYDEHEQIFLKKLPPPTPLITI